LGEIEILANGLLLRPWRAEDAPAVYRACQDPLIQRWTSVPRPYELTHATDFVTTFTSQAWANGTGAPLGVFDEETGDLLGSCGVGGWSGHTAEIGYWVAPWARGRGVATRAAHAVAAWCLATRGVTRLVWRASVGNHASRLVAVRLGFQIEGIARAGVGRSDQEPEDCWVGALRPGQLRDPADPVDPVLRRRAYTFGRPQPRLATSTHHGELFELRPSTRADVEGMVVACSDPESLRWTSVPRPYRPVDAEHFVETYAPGRWARGDGAVYVIDTDGPGLARGASASEHRSLRAVPGGSEPVRAMPGGFAGTMELRLGDGHEADVGFLVAPWARGRGYASAALDALCQWAFAELLVHRISWRAYVGNEASRKVALRAGFTMEGTARAAIRRPDGYTDTWTGARLATDGGGPDDG
jgi:RimJ/RimL family protein N-acetyltransferase